MNRYTSAKNGLGIDQTRHHIAARAARRVDQCENPPRRRVKTGADLLAELLNPTALRAEKRPLAA